MTKAAYDCQCPSDHDQCQHSPALDRHSICRGNSHYRCALLIKSHNPTVNTDKSPQVAVALVSDRIKLRGLPMLIMLPVSIAGYATIAHVQSASVRFGMTCLMAMGMYSSVPCVLVWNANNSAGHYKRATTSALQLAVANCGGFVASMAYPLY